MRIHSGKDVGRGGKPESVMMRKTEAFRQRFQVFVSNDFTTFLQARRGRPASQVRSNAAIGRKSRRCTIHHTTSASRGFDTDHGWREIHPVDSIRIL